jgi:hypothetical protein
MRTVELTNGSGSLCGGHVVVTARGFGSAATTLTVYAIGTPGQPGKTKIGTMKNKNDFAKVAIPWYFGYQTLTGGNVTIRVVGPEGNSAKDSFSLSAYDNFTWGPCPTLSRGRHWSKRQPQFVRDPARTKRAKASSKSR